LRLELWAVDPNNPDNDYLLDYSDSSVDNVEHLYSLADANYTDYEIVISMNDADEAGRSETAQQYALAWTAAEAVSDRDILWYDLNADGIVNKADLMTLVENLLSSCDLTDSYLLGDINTDGAIDMNDVKILLNQTDLRADWNAAQLLLAAFSSGCFAEPWKFAMTCDSRGGFSDPNGINETILGELVAEFVSENVDFILFPGDLVSGMGAVSPDKFESQLRKWVDIVGPLYDAGIGVYIGRGNHEVMDNHRTYPPEPPLDPNVTFAGRWLNVFGSDSDPNQKLPGNGPADEEYMTYSVTHNNAFIVMVDQYAGIEHWLSNQVGSAIRLTSPGSTLNWRRTQNLISSSSAINRRSGPKTERVWISIPISETPSGPPSPRALGEPTSQDTIISTTGPPYSWDPNKDGYPGDHGSYTVEYISHATYRHGYLLVEVNNLDVTLTWVQRHTTDTSVEGVYEPNDTWTYTALPRAILLSPNGGETVSAQSTRTITWKTLEGAEIDSVRIDYSTDDGQTWDEIGVSANTGSYDWATPPADSNQCLIRLTDAAHASLSDTSDRKFTIYPCPDELTVDLNDDCYMDFLDFVILADDPAADFLRPRTSLISPF